MGVLAGHELQLTSVEIWPSAVVVRAHLLGFVPVAGQLHPAGRLRPTLETDTLRLDWTATTVGGEGTLRPVEWTFAAPPGSHLDGPLALHWSESGLQPPSGSVLLHDV